MDAIQELQTLKADFARLQQQYHALQQSLQQAESQHACAMRDLLHEKEFSEKVLQCLPGIFYLYTYPELKLVLWNKNHETLLGYEHEDLKDKHIMDWHVPEAVPLVQQAVDLVMEKGQNVLESPLLSKAGVYIPFLMTGVRAEIHGASYLMGFGIDIRDRQQMERDKKESESLFRLLAENSNDMIAKHDPQGTFTYVTPSCKTLLGYEPDELIGRSAFEFIHPDDIAKIKESRQKITAEQTYTTMTYQIRRKDGCYIWFETISKSIFDPSSGTLSELHASSRDVTARVLSEAQLRESEDRLNTLFGAMTEMVALHELTFDDDGGFSDYRITDVNEAYIRTTGLTREQAVGRLGSEIYGTDEPPYLQEFGQVGLTGIPYEYTTYFAPMDKYFMISVVSTGKNKFATVTTDISDVKRIEGALIEKNKELENYLYVASHDLRSPLVNIQGFSIRLQKQIDQIVQKLPVSATEECDRESIAEIIQDGIPRTLNFIYSSVAKMDALINGLLQISRTGRIRMNIMKVNINELVATVVSIYNFQLTVLNAKVVWNELPDCYGDANQLNQLFSNVISNAIKYHSPDRKLLIEISASTRHNKTVYCIKDNGVGIAPRHIERIWDVFFRVDASSPIAGEGLGLSIAKRIVDKHHGRIWVESEEQAGTRFYIELQNNAFTE